MEPPAKLETGDSSRPFRIAPAGAVIAPYMDSVAFTLDTGMYTEWTTPETPSIATG
jgi:hypothetical protein